MGNHREGPECRAAPEDATEVLEHHVREWLQYGTFVEPEMLDARAEVKPGL